MVAAPVDEALGVTAGLAGAALGEADGLAAADGDADGLAAADVTGGTTTALDDVLVSGVGVVPSSLLKR